VSLKRRVRTAPADAPATGVVATLDDPRLGAVSAALARLRPQLVPDPDAPDSGDDYLADTPYGGHEDAAAETVAEPDVSAAEPEPDAPAAPRLSRWAAALAEAFVDRPAETIPTPPAAAEPVAMPDAGDTELVAASIPAPAFATTAFDAKLEAFFADVDAETATESGGVATLLAPRELALDGTLLPRAPLHRSRMPDRITNAFTRRKKRRHRRR